MRRNKIHTWFFLGNGIGSFLCALNTVETVWFSIPKERRGKCIILVTRDEGLFRELSAMYPHVEVISVNLKNIPTLASIFFNTIIDTHYALHPISFGEHNTFFKLYSRFITFWNRESQNVGAVKDTWINRIVYSKIVARDLSISVFEMEERMAESIMHINKKNIEILFQFDTSLQKHLSVPYIVIHPYAANVGRSLPVDRWVGILEFIHTAFPQLQIIISGSPSDRLPYHEMQTLTTVPTTFIQDITHGSIQKMYQILSGSMLFIGVDTGITHVANMLHKDCIVIGNRSNPCWLPTYNDKAIILTNAERCICGGDKTGGCFVYIEEVRYYRCMIDIAQETIYETITNKLRVIKQ